jgi:hypothetical protein
MYFYRKLDDPVVECTPDTGLSQVRFLRGNTFFLGVLYQRMESPSRGGPEFEFRGERSV